MVPAFFVNLHACGGGLSAIQFETAGSAQTMLSATPSRGMSLMVAGGVSLCELRPEDGRFVQRRHTPNSRPHAVSGSAQIAMPSPLRSIHLRNKGGQKTTTLQGPASTSGGGQDKRTRKQHRNVSPAAAAANNSATATQARQRDNQRALDEKRKERSRKRSGQKLEVLLKLPQWISSSLRGQNLEA